MSQEKVKRNLESLPASTDDEFWLDAELSQHQLKGTAKCDHYFIHRTGREIECRNCHVGFYIGPGANVEAGELTLHGQVVA